MTTTNKRGATSLHDVGIPGVAVDAWGRAVLDPTANVLALVKAANERRDDLSALGDLYTAERIRRVEDLGNKDVKHALFLIKIHAEHGKELQKLHAGYDEKLHAIQTADINAINGRLGPLEKIVFENAAKGVGVSTAWTVLLSSVSLIATLIVIGLFVFNGRSVPAVVPQVTYTPAAPGTMIPSSPVQSQRQ
jgi:hypothetical protein